MPFLQAFAVQLQRWSLGHYEQRPVALLYRGLCFVHLERHLEGSVGLRVSPRGHTQHIASSRLNLGWEGGHLMGMQARRVALRYSVGLQVQHLPVSGLNSSYDYMAQALHTNWWLMINISPQQGVHVPVPTLSILPGRQESHFSAPRLQMEPGGQLKQVCSSSLMKGRAEGQLVRLKFAAFLSRQALYLTTLVEPQYQLLTSKLFLQYFLAGGFGREPLPWGKGLGRLQKDPSRVDLRCLMKLSESCLILLVVQSRSRRRGTAAIWASTAVWCCSVQWMQRYISDLLKAEGLGQICSCWCTNSWYLMSTLRMASSPALYFFRLEMRLGGLFLPSRNSAYLSTYPASLVILLRSFMNSRYLGLLSRLPLAARLLLEAGFGRSGKWVHRVRQLARRMKIQQRRNLRIKRIINSIGGYMLHHRCTEPF